MDIIMRFFLAFLLIGTYVAPHIGVAQGTSRDTLLDTGISGVYEVFLATDKPDYALRYFAEFGFTVRDSAVLSAAQVKSLYGIETTLKAYRLQNGEIDTHGLLRIMVWGKPLGRGVGYSIPETIGSRMAVMMTKDIIRIVDVYKAERALARPWLPIEPIFDDLYKLSDKSPDFFHRPVGVRETVVYGEFFNHVFFQRYGYTIPGYGTINPAAPLQTSEFTHHDFFIAGPSMDVTNYYRDALGFRPEKDAEIDGDWLRGPQRVFDMPLGYSHIYKGFVSPNNICGKLKFFIPQAPKPDKSAQQRVGELGITLHSLWTPKLDLVYGLVKKQGIQPTAIQNNEFGERCFVFRGPDGATWQIIEKAPTQFNYKPATKLEIIRVNN
ncbi:MAG: hypothetical protein RML40_01720 [Bacteroidota bacterium]|nr:hypothetical protein [Candidatus Kapabacteria bacterium]MDW8219227.1 hypothetical protein [Bacteroidota bacterium]